MKRVYCAPKSECIELMHRESLLLDASMGSAPTKNNVILESTPHGWDSSNWSGVTDDED